MPASLHPWLKAHRKALVRTAIALVLLYAVYLVAANVFLSTSLSHTAFNRHPQRFHVAWARAYSLYPGHVHATGLRIGGHVRTNRWVATSPVADTRIRLLPLLVRRLSFSPIDARDVSLTLERDAPFLAPRNVQSRWPPFRLHFDAIRTDSPRTLVLDDFKLDAFRDARIVFAFDKTLRGGPFEILPSTLTARSARLAFRDIVLATDARIDYAMAMAPNSRAQGTGLARVRFVDATLQLQGVAPGLTIAGQRGTPLTFATGQGSGRVALDMALRDGALAPGGTLRWSAPLVLSGAQADARLDRLQVRADVRTDGVHLHALLPKRAGRSDYIDARLAIAERRIRKTSARELLRASSGTVALRWQFNSLRWLTPLITDGGWLRLDGQAEVDANLRVRAGKLAPGSRASIPRAQVQADLFDTVLAGDARATAVVDAQRTTVDIVAERFGLAPRDAPAAKYVEGTNARMRLRASGDLSQFRRTLQADINFGDARIRDLSAYNRYLPAGSVRLQGGRGTLAAQLALDAQGRVRDARIGLRGTGADVRLGPSRILGNLALDTHLRQAGGDARRYRIDTLDLDLSNVRVDAPNAAPWWGQLDFDGGTFDWREPFALNGDARLKLKDASVLLDLFSERSAFPKWIGNLVDAGQVNATARVRVQGDSAAFERIRARNDRVQLQAHLRLAGGQPRGALLAQWGILDVAADVRGNQRRVFMKGAEAWYQRQPAAVR